MILLLKLSFILVSIYVTRYTIAHLVNEFKKKEK